MGSRPPDATEFGVVRVNMLGRFEVTHQGIAAFFRTKKTAALFAYLCYYAGKPISKELVAAAFWPDVDTERGRHSLRMAISSLRSSLSSIGVSASCLESDSSHVRLASAAVDVDVAAFRSAMEREDWRSAASVYGGSLLPGSDEPWVVPQMLELEENYAFAVRSFAETGASSHEVHGAVTRSLALCPLREDLHLALIRCHVRDGNNGLAIRQFETLEQILDEQWGETPSQDAYALLDSLPRAKRDTREAAAVSSEPVALGAFFGRTHELAHLAKQLEPTSSALRLLTLTGLGGTGKTRLAERAFLLAREAFSGRAWFLTMESAKTVAELASRLAEALGVPPRTADPMLEISRRLTGPALLVLDNLEQLVPEIGPWFDELVTLCPELRVLATSRVPLGAHHEAAYGVGPLPLPEGYANIDILRTNPCVQLLVDAAQGVRLGFAATTMNARSVYELCHRLEGIPLAIELAASHLAFKTPAQVLGSLGRRTDLVGAKPRVERHQSIGAIIEWSVDQLSDASRAAFDTLGMCRGGFTLELAQTMLPENCESALQELVKASLLSWQEDDSEVRFSMLETVREAAAARLEGRPGECVEAAQRHFAFIERLVVQEVDDLTIEEQEAWTASIDREHPNIVAAIEFAAAGYVGAERAWGLVGSLQEHMLRRGQFHRWATPLDALLTATEPSLPATRAARANSVLARVSYGRRDIPNTYRYWRKSIDAADASGDLFTRADVRSVFANVASLYGHYEEAKREIETAIAILRGLDEPALLARCLVVLGWLLFDENLKGASIEPFRESLSVVERCNDQWVRGSCLSGFGASIAHVDFEESARCFDRAVQTLRPLPRPEALAFCLYNRGLIEYQCGHLDQARVNVDAAFQVFVRHGISLGQVPLMVAGNLLSARGDLEGARACWIRSERARRRHKMSMFPVIRADFERELQRHGLSEASIWNRFEMTERESDEEFAGRIFAYAGVS